ncbi:MAG TPA: VWA domain-containing protein [Longimicrobium sp.]|nr:VWA domain-containing protein [Longimicrobium sp.]
MPIGLLARLRGARPAADADAPPPVALEDVRRRLELLLAAVYGHPVTVAAADAPRRPGPLRRLLGRIPPHLLPTGALPTTDGERVLLPASMAAEGDAVGRYRLMAIQQAERLERGTVAALAGDEPPLVRDLYLLAESAAVDQAIARTAPGLAPTQAAERAAALARRPALDALTPVEGEVERMVRGVLASDAASPADLPADAGPGESLAWARATAARLAAAGSRYRGVPPVDAWGTVPPGRGGAAAKKQTASLNKHGHRPRPPGGGRGMQVQGAGQGEGGDPSQPLHALPNDKAKGREADPTGDSHMDAGGGTPDGELNPPDSMSGTSMEGEGRAPAKDALPAAPVGIPYPEWDCYQGGYRRPGAWVRIAATAPGDSEWSRAILRMHAAAVRRLREQFERLRARRQRLTAQRDGEELDLGACVRALVDLRTGHTVSDRLYAAVRPARRELSILLLVDISGSTTEHVNRVRIIDVEMEALLLASEAFDALGDRYAVLTFSGQGAQNVRMRVVKDFSERNGDEVRGRVAALRPEGYTRMGAAIRHASGLLAREGARHRLLLIISDGKPNDEDHYQGRYAVEDTRQAVNEARAGGIFPFCVTVDQKGGEYLSRIFGASGHMILHHPEHLPLALLKVVRGLLRG